MKLAICLPTGTKVHATFAISLAAMMAATDGVEVSFINYQSSLIADSRNKCVLAALEHQPDKVMFIDSDMSFPVDTLARLWQAGKPIIGCNYVMRNPPHNSLSVGLEGEGVVEVERMPLGLCLIDADVFRQLPKPWFATPVVGDDFMGEDYYFCALAKSAGFALHVDTDLSKEVAHWGDMGFMWDGKGFRSVECA